MPLRDLLTFGSKSDPFESWPSAPKVKPIVSSRKQEKSGAALFSLDTDPHSYPATLIVAIGETGERTLQLLAEKGFQDNDKKVTNLRLMLIKSTQALLRQNIGLPVRILELQRNSSRFASRDSRKSARLEIVDIFRQVVNYRRYHEWLQENLLDLGSNTQVFFIGSAAEPEIGILGELLQILWNFPRSMGRTSLFSRVNAFLSLHSSTPTMLPIENVFAVCRELGRFTFPGPHKMREDYGGDLVVHSALLDSLFLLDGSASSDAASSDKDGAQVLAESIYVLIHSSSPKIWENLKNNLSASGQVRYFAHQAVIHGLGIATLYIPTTQIKRYVAARLAYAALFGEQSNLSEGLICRRPVQPEQPISAARRFLTSKPYDHPVFQWILNANSSSYFDVVPDLGPDYVTAFQGQISHSIINALSETPADLPHICLALDVLEKHLAQCEGWFNSSRPVNKNAPERFAFQYVLTKWQESLSSLLKELHGWEQALFPEDTPEAADKSATSLSDWRNSGNLSGWRGDAKEDTDLLVKKDVQSVLTLYRKSAEKALAIGFGDQTYRSVASDGISDLNEIEKYYTDTVRPELSRFNKEPSLSFKRVHDRLEWWIRLVPNQSPQLYLVCWPFQDDFTPEPNPSYCFRSNQAQEFTEAIFHLALSQTSALEADLTGTWFSQRTRLLVGFLGRANQAYLAYDPNVATMDMDNVASRQSYLISHDPTLSRELIPNVFPETLRREINEIDGGEPTRLTALSMRLNIPIGSVTVLKNVKDQYIDNIPEKMHLYVQEQTACVYEKHFRKLERIRILLSPDFVALLADPQLVTLFCQGLFTGVIHSVHDEGGSQLFWKVSAVDHFKEIELAPIGADGLLTAFRRFALELPNEPNLNQNPHKNFYPEKRGQYLNALTEKIKKTSIGTEARAIRESLKQELEYWRKKGDSDELARSFSVILQCELDEPIWKDW